MAAHSEAEDGEEKMAAKNQAGNRCFYQKRRTTFADSDNGKAYAKVIRYKLRSKSAKKM